MVSIRKVAQRLLKSAVKLQIDPKLQDDFEKAFIHVDDPEQLLIRVSGWAGYPVAGHQFEDSYADITSIEGWGSAVDPWVLKIGDRTVVGFAGEAADDFQSMYIDSMLTYDKELDWLAIADKYDWDNDEVAQKLLVTPDSMEAQHLFDKLIGDVDRWEPFDDEAGVTNASVERDLQVDPAGVLIDTFELYPSISDMFADHICGPDRVKLRDMLFDLPLEVLVNGVAGRGSEVPMADFGDTYWIVVGYVQDLKG